MTNLSEITGLTVHVFQPTWMGGEFIEDLSRYMSGYSHEKGANIGCVNAQISLSTDWLTAQSWFSDGLGRIVRVYNQAGVCVWIGFVNLVTVSVGILTGETRGPLLDIGNRVSAVYTPLDVSVWPPVAGTTTITTINEDTISQARYGVIEKVISAGTAPDDDAERARDNFLAEKAYPKSTGEVDPSAANTIALTLDCLGNYYWLDAYIYNDYTAGYITLSDKIKAIIAADPNTILIDQGLIKDNPYLTGTAEDQNRFASTITQDIIRLGDISDNRWLFGVNADGIAYYDVISSEIKYEIALADQRQAVKAGDSEVYPWDVEAGHWIMVTDWLAGIEESTGNSDPRRKFIESVKYTAPWGLSLADGDSGTLSQLLAKLGA